MASPYELWEQAGGGTPEFSPDRYRELMLEHGLIRPLAPGEEREPLPCGWPPSGGEAVRLRGRGGRQDFVHFGPEPGVCSVDPDGCGYCIGVPCREPLATQEVHGGDRDEGTG